MYVVTIRDILFSDYERTRVTFPFVYCTAAGNVCMSYNGSV